MNLLICRSIFSFQATIRTSFPAWSIKLMTSTFPLVWVTNNTLCVTLHTKGLLKKAEQKQWMNALTKNLDKLRIKGIQRSKLNMENKI